MKKETLFTPSLFFTLVLISFSFSQSIQADTFMVTNTNSSGSGSLRWAITNANTTPSSGLHHITFSVILNGTPIILAGANGEDANASGDLDILKGKLVIQGNGVENTIIDGGGIDRVFHICPGGGCNDLVTIKAMTVRNGNAATGAGIFNNGWTQLIGSTVSANSAASGGGIYNLGVLSLTEGSIIGGTGAGNSASVEGGGIHTGNNSWTGVYVGTISANSANWGGGIFNRGELNIGAGSIIGGEGAGNSADLDGGGIYNSGDGVITVEASMVSSNMATNGGGIYNLHLLAVENGALIGGAGAGNKASEKGGGIYNAVSGGAMVTDSCIYNNEATINAGGMYNDGGMYVTGNNIVNNSDTSLFNNHPVQYTATSNWWGVATGPNTPGADTVGGNVDTSSFLTKPIHGCFLPSFFWPMFLPAIMGDQQ